MSYNSNPSSGWQRDFQPPPAPSTLAPTPDQDALWLWQDDDSDWIPYDSRPSFLLEKAYCNGDASAHLDSSLSFASSSTSPPSQGYSIIFNPDGKITQRNNQSKFFRAVRRDPAPQSRTIVWEWSDGITWTKYDDQAQAALETALAHGLDTAILNHGFFRNSPNGYSVDLRALSQRNNSTGGTRQVRRQVHWASTTAKLSPSDMVLVPLPTASKPPQPAFSSAPVQPAIFNPNPNPNPNPFHSNPFPATYPPTSAAPQISFPGAVNPFQTTPPPPPVPPRQSSIFQQTLASPPTVFPAADDNPECPICFKRFPASEILAHANRCIEGDGGSAMRKSFGEVPISRDRSRRPAPTGESLRRSGGIPVQEYDPITMKNFECPICMDDVPPGGGYRYEDCQHAYCGPCLSGYYKQAIMNGKADDIKCPDPKCEHPITFEEVRFLVDRDMFNKYREFKRVAAINKDPEMRWCSNPVGCGNAFKRKDPKSRAMRCNQCQYEFCFDCGEEFHGDMTCDAFRVYKAASNKTDIRMWFYEAFNTKACPKCKTKIQKNGGCNHMTCQKCRHEFCWICAADYTSDHFSRGLCGLLSIFK